MLKSALKSILNNLTCSQEQILAKISSINNMSILQTFVNFSRQKSICTIA